MTLALEILLAVVLLWFAGWLIRAGWTEVTDPNEQREMLERFKGAAE